LAGGCASPWSLGAGICPQPAIGSLKRFMGFLERHPVAQATGDKQPLVSFDSFRLIGIAPNKAVEVNSPPLRRLYFHSFIGVNLKFRWLRVYMIFSLMY